MPNDLDMSVYVLVTANQHKFEVTLATVWVHRRDLKGKISVATTHVKLPMPMLKARVKIIGIGNGNIR